MADAGRPVVLGIEGIRKQFPGAKALDWSPADRIDLRAGEIHALVGENGAGKSTLIQILGGIYQPDAGSLTLQGAPYLPTGVEDARRKGVALVLQEPALVATLTVAENLFLGQEREFTRFGVLSVRERDGRARDALGAVGLAMPPSASVSDLTYEERKLVEVTRAVSAAPSVLVIDETTASLSLRGKELLYRQIRAVRDRGAAVVYISHYLEEIFELCDRVSVLKDGKLVGTWEIADTSVDGLSHAMVGRDLDFGALRGRDAELRPGDAGQEPVLRVSGLGKAGSFRDVSLELRPGEILGIGGLVGCGSTELGRCLFGAAEADEGEIAVAGRRERPGSPGDGVALGLGYVPKERDEEGLILPFTIADNISLPIVERLRQAGFINPGRERDEVAGAIRRYRVKAEGPGTVCLNLSGGNRQKVVLAKWLATDSRIIVLNSPTRGIDVGAKAEIYDMMREIARSGRAILMITEELPELIAMSDRIMVMRRGEVSARFDGGPRPTEEQLIQHMV